MEIKESSTSGPVLFCAFIMLINVYWGLWFTIHHGLARFTPHFYSLLQVDRGKKMIAITMMMRVLLGVGLTMPSCAYAAYTTASGLGQPLNCAGQVCMATQALVWAVEIPFLIGYNTELLIHHVLCNIVLANAILSPTLHQLKPVLIYFAAQMGDLGPGTITVLKTSGRKPHNSWSLYCVGLASTVWLTFGKVGSTLSSVSMALENPYRMTDLVWGFCLLFFSVYSLYRAQTNLWWLGVLRSDEKSPFRVVFAKRFSISQSHMYFGLALGVMLVSTMFVYCFYNDQPVTQSQMWTISICGFFAASMGMTCAITMKHLISSRNLIRDPSSMDLCRTWGMLISAAWLHCISRGTQVVDVPKLIAAIGVSLPLLEGISQFGHSSASREHAHALKQAVRRLRHDYPVEALGLNEPSEEELEEEDKKPNATENPAGHGAVDDASAEDSDTSSPKEKGTLTPFAKAVLDSYRSHVPDEAHKQRAMAWASFAIFALSIVCLSTDLLSVHDVGVLAAISVISQKMFPNRYIQSPHPRFLFATLILYFPWLFGLLKYSLSRHLMNAQAAVVLLLAGRYVELTMRPRPRPKVKEASAGNEKKRKRFFLANPLWFSLITVSVVQGLMAYEVWRNPDYSKVREAPQGWKNFRNAVGSPYMWISSVYLMAMPVVGMYISGV